MVFMCVMDVSSKIENIFVVPFHPTCISQLHRSCSHILPPCGSASDVPAVDAPKHSPRMAALGAAHAFLNTGRKKGGVYLENQQRLLRLRKICL